MLKSPKRERASLEISMFKDRFKVEFSPIETKEGGLRREYSTFIPASEAHGAIT